MAGWVKRVDGSGFDRLETSLEAQEEENKPFSDKLRCLFNEFLSVFRKEKFGSSSVCDIAPMLGNGQSVDVFKVYLVVREKGGCEKVSEKGLWSSVAEECGYHAIFGSALKLVLVKYLVALNACFQGIAESKESEDSSESCVKSINQDTFSGCKMDLESMKRFFSEAMGEMKNVGDGPFVKPGSKMPGLDSVNELRFSGIDDVKLNGDKAGIRNVNTEGLAYADNNNNGLLRFNGKMEGSGGGNGPNGQSFGKKNVQNMMHSHRAGIKSVHFDENASTNAADSLAVSTANDLKRKREYASAILNWLDMVAKNPCNPIIGELPESSKWKYYTSIHIWKQILLFREWAMLKKNMDSNEQKLNSQKKQKIHPMMYDDHHTISEKRRSEKQRYSQRILSAKECPKKNIPKSSSSSSSSVSRSDPETDFPDPSVLIGRNYQAEVSDWVGKARYEPDSKWEGDRLWPGSNGKSATSLLIEREPMGRGRRDGFCGCLVRDSIECVKFHVTEKRTRLKLELGNVYYHMRFDSMGENASFPWLKMEEKMFYETVKRNPFYLGCFWKEIRKSLPKHGIKSIVSYYFNVFNLRRRGDQNRLTPGEINSDDDDDGEPNDGGG